MVGKAYALEFRPDTEQDLKNLDRSVAQRLLTRLKWLVENFDSIAPEQLSGKDLQGIFKFRVGDYRFSIRSIERGEFSQSIGSDIGARFTAIDLDALEEL